MKTMKKDELIAQLEEVVQRDIIGQDISVHDHPATVAIRAINQCFEDVERIQLMAEEILIEAEAIYDEKHDMLIHPYNPEW